MLFTTLHWAIFLVVAFSAYHATPTRFRRWLMLAASIYFYATWSVPYLLLIAGQLVVDWTCAHMLSRSDVERRRKAILAVSIVVNLSVLCLFKYYGLFSRTLSPLGVALPAVELLLPLGISFYTFESMSYTIDVYRRELAPVKSPLHLALFIMWFPHLIAGPIIRPSEFIPQLHKVESINRERFVSGLNLMLMGFAKKLLVADWLARVVDPVFASPAAYTSVELLVGIYAYAFQIYLDFSAYTDIARGASRWFGIELPENFDAPYLATSITDFWRRWHMTLSRWLRDYLYISLGGNRKGDARTYANLMATMLLGGLWHGASWTFLVWGGLHGLFLAIERRLGIGPAAVPPSALSLWTRRFVTFHLVCFAWVPFRATSFGHALEIFRGLASGTIHVTSSGLLPVVGALVLIGSYWAIAPVRRWVTAVTPGESLRSQLSYACAIGLFLVVLMVFGASTNAFIYFQF